MKNFLFLFSCFLFLPFLSSAQNNTPTLTYEQMRRLKFNVQILIPLEKQVLPFRDKVALRFEELGMIYNPTFPETTNKVYAANFRRIDRQFDFIGKSISTFRATVFIREQGIFYGVWNDGNCVSLIEYKVIRVGDKLEVTGNVYACLIAS